MTLHERPPASDPRAPPVAVPGVPRRPTEPPARVMMLLGPISRGAIPALCDRLRRLLEDRDTAPVVCDVGGLGAPDAVTIDVLARLQLTALRLGHKVVLRQACEELEELLVLTGLDDLLPCVGSDAASGVEVWGQPEQREQPWGVEEEADPGDRTV